MAFFDFLTKSNELENRIFEQDLEIKKYQSESESMSTELKKVSTQMEIITNLSTSYQTALYGFLNNGQPVQLGDNTFTYVQDGYQFNADVYTCVDLILQKLAACTPIVYEVKKENLGNVQKYRNLMQSQTKEARIQAKALELKSMKEVYQPDISALLNTPNPYQTYAEWLKHYAGFYLLTGNTYNYYNYINPAKPVKPKEMFVLPAQFVSIMSGGPMQPIKGYRIINQRFFGAAEIDFATTEVSHLKTFNPNYTNYGSQLYGQSPLMAYRLTLQKNKDARIEANKQMKNGGVFGILSPGNGAPAMTVDQSRDLKEQIQSKKMSRGELIERIFASAAPLDWQQIGLPLSDMMLLESLDFDRKDIANAYHIPITLLNDMSASTDNNVAAHMKQFIYNVITPLANAISDRLTRDICTGYNTATTSYVIQLDPSTLPDMQEDMAKVAQWMNTAWWLTPNQKLTGMGFGESKEPNMDKVLVPSTYRLIDDLSMNEADFTAATDTGLINN